MRDEEDDEDYNEIHGDELISKAYDLIYILSKSLGDEFLIPFGKLASLVFDYLTEKHPKSDKREALGCLTVVFETCPSAISLYFLQFVNAIEENSKSVDSRMNRNIAYAIGILA